MDSSNYLSKINFFFLFVTFYLNQKYFHLILTLQKKKRNECTNAFRWFFLNTALEILFGLFIGIGWFHGGGGGLITMVYNFQHDPPCVVAGVFCAICVFLILILTIFHIRLFRQVKYNIKLI